MTLRARMVFAGLAFLALGGMAPGLYAQDEEAASHDGPVVSLRMVEAPLRDVLNALMDAGLSVVLPDGTVDLDRTVTVNFRETPLDVAAETVCNALRLEHDLWDGVLVLYGESSEGRLDEIHRMIEEVEAEAELRRVERERALEDAEAELALAKRHLKMMRIRRQVEKRHRDEAPAVNEPQPPYRWLFPHDRQYLIEHLHLTDDQIGAAHEAYLSAHEDLLTVLSAKGADGESPLEMIHRLTHQGGDEQARREALLEALRQTMPDNSQSYLEAIEEVSARLTQALTALTNEEQHTALQGKRGDLLQVWVEGSAVIERLNEMSAVDDGAAGEEAR